MLNRRTFLGAVGASALGPAQRHAAAPALRGSFPHGPEHEHVFG